ncbi:MAG: hypothetical protein ABW067_08830 [Rhizobacter sp.]
MNPLVGVGVVATALAAACSSGHRTVDVTILPTQYRVGEVVSDVAAPVVAEVVRLRPHDVHVHTCHSTPPARVSQFHKELEARLQAKMTLSFTARDC